MRTTRPGPLPQPTPLIWSSGDGPPRVLLGQDDHRPAPICDEAQLPSTKVEEHNLVWKGARPQDLKDHLAARESRDVPHVPGEERCLRTQYDRLTSQPILRADEATTPGLHVPLRLFLQAKVQNPSSIGPGGPGPPLDGLISATTGETRKPPTRSTRSLSR